MNTHKFLPTTAIQRITPVFGRIGQRAHQLINNEGIAPEEALHKIRQELGEQE